MPENEAVVDVADVRKQKSARKSLRRVLWGVVNRLKALRAEFDELKASQKTEPKVDEVIEEVDELVEELEQAEDDIIEAVIDSDDVDDKPESPAEVEKDKADWDAQHGTPQPGAAGTQSGEASRTHYTAHQGDTLSEIARDHGTTVAKLQSLNPSITNPDVIREGQRIRLK